jgi:predicted anti-sigma-YlaC factor YlaD
MSCMLIRELFSAYLDNALSLDKKKRVDEHIKVCSACNSELQQLKSMINILNNIENPAAPAGFSAELLNKIRHLR